MHSKKALVAAVAQRPLPRLQNWLLILMALSLAACEKQTSQKPRRSEVVVPVTVAPARLVPLDRFIPSVGTLCAKDDAMLGAEVEGRVEKTLVEFGDRVSENQLLAQIDTTTYEALARQAHANLAKAEANAANVDHTLKRIQQLQKDSIASQSDLDSAVADAGQALASVKAAEAAEAVARLNVERSRIKAPFAAAVAERVASAGDYLKVGSPVFRLVNDAELKYVFQVLESQAGQVRNGQLVRFTVDAYPDQPFEGKIYLISPQVNMSTRSFNVAALVPNPERRLKASTYARGELVVERAVPTLVVPLQAVIYFAGVSKVFVVEKEIARGRQVEVGRVKADAEEIVAGLKPGEIIVVSGHSKLFDGAKVRIKER